MGRRVTNSEGGSGGGGGSGGHVIKQDATTFTQRPTLRIGDGLVVTDDPFNLETLLELDTIDGSILVESDLGDTVAPLIGGLVPAEFLPALAINDVFTVASQAEMLALSADVGDVAIRTDTEQTYILSAAPASTLGNWTVLSFGAGVTSVNGFAGTVNLGGAQIPLDDAGWDAVLFGVNPDVQSLADAVNDLNIPTSLAPEGAAGGELDGDYPNPTVAITHSGSSHASVQAAAEATAQDALDTHVALTADAHVASSITIDGSAFFAILTGVGDVQAMAATLNALTGEQIPLDTAPFTLNLGPAESNMQAFAEKMDQLVFTSPVSSVNTQTGAVVLDAAAVGALSATLAGVPDGIATLDSDGRLSLAEWPDGLVTTVNGYNGSEITLVGVDIELDDTTWTTNLLGVNPDVQSLANAVDGLVTAGGSLPTPGDEGSILQTTSSVAAWNVDLIMADSSEYGPDVVGGKIINAAGVTVERAPHLTEVGTDPNYGTGFLYIYSPNLDNDGILIDFGGGPTPSGPTAQTGWFGPRGAFEFEGLATISQSQTAYVFTPVAFVNAHFTKNAPDVAIHMTPAWGYINSPIFIADGDTVTQNSNDTTHGYGAFVDTTTIMTGDTGTWSGSTKKLESYIAHTQVLGNATIGQKTGFAVYSQPTTAEQDIQHIVFDNMNDQGYFGFDTGVDTAYGSITTQIGFWSERLTNATTNWSAWFESSVALWKDTYTHPSSSGPVLDIGGTHTLDYASADFKGLNITPTIIFTAAASGFGAATAVNAQTTIHTDGTASGALFTFNTTFNASPTWSVNTTPGAISATTFRSFVDAPIYARASGSNAFTIANLYGFYSAPTVNTGVTAVTRYGMYIDDASGTATTPFTTNIGLFVAGLSKGTNNIGILNASTTIGLGGFYGGLIASSDTTIGTNLSGTPGVIRLDNPSTEIGVSNTTYTGSGSYLMLFADNTVSMSGTGGGAGTGNGYKALDLSQTVIFTTAGKITDAANGYADQNTYRATSSVETGVLNSFNAAVTVNATAATATTAAYIGFHSGPTTSQTTSGSLAMTSLVQFYANTATIGANTSVAARYGLLVNNAAFTSGGGNSFTAQYGVDILALSGATTNIGIRNANSLVNTGTIYGSQSASGSVTIQSTTDTTKGYINLDNPLIELWNSNFTLAGTNVSYYALIADNTVTMNSSGGSSLAGNSFRAMRFAQTIDYSQAGHITEGGSTIVDVNTYQSSVNGTALGVIASFQAAPTLKATATGITSIGYVGFGSTPTLVRTSSNDITVTSVTQFSASAPVVNTGNAITTRYGLLVANAASALIGTNIAVDIQTQTLGTAANIGLRNASTSVFTTSVATLSAVGNAIAPDATVKRLNNTSGGSLTLTSAPTIANGQDGQILILFNSSAQNVVLQDQGTLGSSNLRLVATTITLATRDSVVLMYSTDIGDWIQLTSGSATPGAVNVI